MQPTVGYIPAPEPIPLPAPVWLLKALLFITFVLHLVPMNLTLGGLAFLSLNEWMKRGDERLQGWVASYLPVTTAFTITTGVAPLLFLQVLYGQFFFPAAILIAWAWLAVIAALLLGYYGIYAYAWASEGLGRWRVWVIVGSTLLFLYVAFAFNNAITLMSTPFRWWQMWEERPSGWNLNLWEPTLVPRFAHFVLGAVAFFGLTMALYGVAIAFRRDESFGTLAHRKGVEWFATATLLNYFVAPLFLFTHEQTIWQQFVGGDVLSTVLLWVGVAASVIGVILALGSLRSSRPLPFVLIAFISLGVTVIGMAGVRYLLRDHLLALHAPEVRLEALPVQPQWGIVVLFVALLLLGLAIVSWMVVQLQRAFARTM